MIARAAGSSRRVSAQGARLLAVALLAAAATAPAGAAFDSDPVGTVGAQFLKLPADARGAGLGSAMTAAADDAGALYWNPAALAGLTRRSLGLSLTRHLESVTHGFMAYAHPVSSAVEPQRRRRRREPRPSPLGSLAAGVLYLNAGRFEELNNTGNKTGESFMPSDVALMAGWGGTLTRSLDVGLALKYVNSHLHSSASTGALDAGARVRLMYNEVPVMLAAAARNVGGRLRYREASEPLPASYHLGASARPLPRWLVSAEAVLPNDGAPYPCAGAEVEFPRPWEVRSALRLGFNGRATGGLEGLSSLAVGAGFGWRALGIDYGWQPFGNLGSSHRVSLSFNF